MTEEEFNLSEKRERHFRLSDTETHYFYEEKFVKEFVRRLKEELIKRINTNINVRDIDEGSLYDWELREIIDKLAGKSLC